MRYPFITLTLLAGCGGHFDFHNTGEDLDGRFRNFFLGPVFAVDRDDTLLLEWDPDKGGQWWELTVAVPVELVADGAVIEEGIWGSACVRTLAGCGRGNMTLTRARLEFTNVVDGPSCSAGLDMTVRWDLGFGDEGSDTEPWAEGRGRAKLDQCIP